MPRRTVVVVSMVALIAFAVVTGALIRSQAPPAPPNQDLSGVEPAELTGELRTAFHEYVAEALQRHRIPGAAVAVVQDGETVYAEGFGVRESGGSEPVTPDTLMMIGSITKSMTSMLTASLVDDGWVTWDTPMVDLLPDFAVADEDLTSRLTIADSFCACTGVPRQDFPLVFNLDAMMDPTALIASLQDMPLTAPLGERFQYSNQMYAVGGYAAAVAAGASANDLYNGYRLAMQDRVFNPIGMDRSTLLLEDVLRSGDFAVPHSADLSGDVQRIPLLLDQRFVDTVAPAGAVWSTATDMARYLLTHLNMGIAPDGTRVVSAENIGRTHAPRVGSPATPPEIPQTLAEASTHYGMGWVVGEWRGQRLVWHDGGTFGFGAHSAFLPDAGIGVVVLTNSAQAGLFNLDVEFRLFELLFEQEPEFGQIVEQFREMQAGQLEQVNAQVQPVDPEAVAPYLGRFEDPVLGEVELRLRDDELIFDTGELRSRMRPMVGEDGNAMGYLFLDPPMAGLTLVRFETVDGSPRLTATIPGEYPGEETTYVFTQAGVND